MEEILPILLDAVSTSSDAAVLAILWYIWRIDQRFTKITASLEYTTLRVNRLENEVAQIWRTMSKHSAAD